MVVTLKSGQREYRRPAVTSDRQARRQAATLFRRAGESTLERPLADAATRGVRVKKRLWLTHSLVVDATSPQLIDLAARNDVRAINTDKHVVTANLDASRPLVRADLVEGLGFTGAGVDVAVLDSGVDFTHRDLAAAMGNQLDFTGDPADPANPPEGVGDLHGHGTHCAGVVGGRGKKYRGMAPGCTIHDYKHLNALGRGRPGDGIEAIQQAVTDGIQILSNSWGATHADGAWVDPDGTCILCVAADAAVANGAVFVVAAGNDDDDSCATYDSHIGCPGNARNAITVAASDDDDDMADFSSIGPTPDGRAKPDVTAPGVDIVACRASTGSDMGGEADVVDDIYLESSGTSMATPHVAGIVALMLEKNPALTPDNAKLTLMGTAVNIGATANEMGAGRVDALSAVNSA